MAIEQFNPNIKSPGIKYNPQGAYAKGSIGEQADWAAVYDAINKSMTGMMSAIGQTVAIDQQLLKTITEKGENFQQGVSNLQESGNSVLSTTADNIIKEVSNNEATEWNQLNRLQKKQAIEKLNKVQGTKDIIGKVVGDIGNSNVNNINWSNFSKNPKVKKLFNHILTGEALEGEDLFSISTDGSVSWQGNDISLADLQSGSAIFEDATELRGSVKTLLDNSVKLGIQRRDNLATKTDGIGGGTAMDKDKFVNDQIANIRGLSADMPDNSEFIFNNLTHVINPENRVTTYDPNNEQHVADVEQYISDYILRGMGEDPTVARSAEEVQAAKDRAAGKTKIGTKTVDAAVVSRARGLVPVLQELTSHTEGDLGPLTPMTRDAYLQLKTDSENNPKTKIESKNLFTAINSGRGALQNGDVYLAKAIDKYNSGGYENLDAEERDVIKKYKAYVGAFDETTDLTQYFDPRAIDRSSPVNYNRLDKTITLKLPNAESRETFDLKDPERLSRITELMMNVQGLNQVDGGYVLKYLFDNSSENNIFITDPNKPKLD
tara:strand:+ start:820 stop:2463 length:1644 start_codon:yes stop_codon:yes gene_type:complete